MDLGIQGRVAIVTGGSRGIGRETARCLLEAGARVTICARTPDALAGTRADLAAKTGGEGHAVVADTSVEADIDRLVREAADRFGAADILINNAGTMYSGRFDALTETGLRAQLETKLFGFMRAIRLVVPGMKARGWGRIVNVIRGAGKEPDPYMFGPRHHEQRAAQRHQVAVDGARPARHPGQRGLSRLGRHRPLAAQRGRAGGRAGRAVRGRGAADRRTEERARPLRAAGGARRGDRVPLLRARELHHRRVDQRGRRAAEEPLVRSEP